MSNECLVTWWYIAIAGVNKGHTVQPDEWHDSSRLHKVVECGGGNVSNGSHCIGVVSLYLLCLRIILWNVGSHCVKSHCVASYCVAL